MSVNSGIKLFICGLVLLGVLHVTYSAITLPGDIQPCPALNFQLAPNTKSFDYEVDDICKGCPWYKPRRSGLIIYYYKIKLDGETRPVVAITDGFLIVDQRWTKSPTRKNMIGPNNEGFCFKELVKDNCYILYKDIPSAKANYFDRYFFSLKLPATATSMCREAVKKELTVTDDDFEPIPTAADSGTVQTDSDHAFSYY